MRKPMWRREVNWKGMGLRVRSEMQKVPGSPGTFFYIVLEHGLGYNDRVEDVVCIWRQGAYGAECCSTYEVK